MAVQGWLARFSVQYKAWLQSIKYLLTHNGVGDVFLDHVPIAPNFGKTFVKILNDTVSTDIEK